MSVIFVLILKSGCKRDTETEELREANSVLVKEGQKLTQTLKESESKVSQFEQKSAELIKENQKLKARIASLESQRRTMGTEVASMSTDTIYALLQEIYTTPALDYWGTADMSVDITAQDTQKLYKFTPTQIKSIYLTRIEQMSLLRSDSNYVVLVQNLEKQLTFKDSVISQKDVQIIIYKDKLDLKEGIIINKDDIIKYQEAEIKYQKRTKFFWQLGALGAGVVAVLVAL